MSTEISTNTAPARGLALATVADAMRFGETVANSEFAPKDFKGKPASCMLAIQCGAEIGLAPLQALQSIAVINGKPAVYGDAAMALVKASHVCEYVTESVEGDGEQMAATCTAKRRGYPSATVVRFTVADAKKAGLWGKAGPWAQYPKRMLQMRARGFALRDAFPDVLKGLVTAEEAQDYPTSEPARPAVEVRPKFDAPQSQPPASNTATDADMQQARLAISRAKTPARLSQIKATVEQRIAADFYAKEQATELLDLIDTRIELLTPRGDAYEGDDNGVEFAHEAAAHEGGAA